MNISASVSEGWGRGNENMKCESDKIKRGNRRGKGRGEI